MRRSSFTMPISFLHNQLCCLWSKRLVPVILITILILSLLCGYKFYIYREAYQQVSILEAKLINFDQTVRAKHNLASEKVIVEQKLNVFKALDSTKYYQELVNYLLDIASLIPTSLVLSKLELLPGDKIIVEGSGSSPDQIINFWRKLLSLDYVISGKLDTIKTDKTESTDQLEVKKKLARSQFSLQLKIN